MNKFLLTFLILTLSINVVTSTKCEDMCDSIGGTCKDNVCSCKRDYSSFGLNGYKFFKYKKYHTVFADLLELFLGFGIGHLYCQRKVNGMFKVFLYFIIYCCSCSFLLTGAKLDSDLGDENRTAFKISLIISVTCFLAVFIWQMVDCILFVMGFYKDGNMIDLY